MRGDDQGDDISCDEFRMRLNQGPDKGETITLEFPESPTTPDLDPGDRVVLSYNPSAEPGFEYQFADRQRRPVLLWLTILFAIAVIALGGWRGLTALAGLGATIVVLLVFVLPAILDGRSPVLVAVFGASAIAYLALYLAHGFKTMTTVALLGTLAALALTVVLASVFTAWAEFTGLATEEAVLVQIGAENVDLSGLVLGGMVIGALGALDDMTVTQASAVWELRATSGRVKRRDLTRSAVRIGRDHVASTVNTLALAYAGAALPLLILLVQSHQSLGTVANSETIAVEIVRTLVGSIGLVGVGAADDLAGGPDRDRADLAPRLAGASGPKRAGGPVPYGMAPPEPRHGGALAPEQEFWGRGRGDDLEPPPVPPEDPPPDDPPPDRAG